MIELKDQRAVFIWASKNHFDSPIEMEPLDLNYEPSWKVIISERKEIEYLLYRE